MVRRAVGRDTAEDRRAEGTTDECADGQGDGAGDVERPRDDEGGDERRAGHDGGGRGSSVSVIVNQTVGGHKIHCRPEELPRRRHFRANKRTILPLVVFYGTGHRVIESRRLDFVERD